LQGRALSRFAHTGHGYSRSTHAGPDASQPLLISSLIEFAERHHGDAEIVSRRVEGDIHRYTWRDLARRARQLANVLDGLELVLATAWPRWPGTATATWSCTSA
jgi:acyl-CoA synthetase (AMP-forming)/AMP-acid ligase II